MFADIYVEAGCGKNWIVSGTAIDKLIVVWKRFRRFFVVSVTHASGSAAAQSDNH